ncbi:MAG: glycosyltransferase [Candidatus Berkelbacteria bacterium]|nr:glycosyltransferase [Candidatus Berkelbacteria bacterium]
MKIAFVCDAYIPVPSGTAVSVETLRITFEKLGHQVYIFAPKYRGLKVKEKRVARLPGIFKLSDKYHPRIWPTANPSKELIKKLKIDIVHSHYFFSTFPFAKKLADFCGAPLVNTYYKVMPEYARQFPDKFSFGLRSNYSKVFDKVLRYSNSCDQIVALSQTSKEYYIDMGVNVPIEVLPVGIFPKDYISYPPNAMKERFKIPENRKVLLYVARLEPDCNFVFLLKAFKKIWRAIDDVHLLIIGGGSKLDEYRQIARHQTFGKFVTLAGYLPKNQVNRIYGTADVFIYPKTLDPQPLVVLESMAAGTPVVCARGFGAQEFVSGDEDGLVSKPTIEDFSEKTIDILRRDKMRLELSMRARVNVKNFKASNLTQDLLHLYETLKKQKKNNLF